jgi:hypothetical protein
MHDEINFLGVICAAIKNENISQVFFLEWPVIIGPFFI